MKGVVMEIKEPEIKKYDVLVLEDDAFCKENICIVTGCGTGIGRATAIAASVNKLKVIGIDINKPKGKKQLKWLKPLAVI